MIVSKNSNQATPRGWIFYDGACRHCSAAAKRFERLFERRGFALIPLQTPWVQKRLRLNPTALLEEMRLLTDDGKILGGADAVIFLAGQVWWAWPFYSLAQLPGMHGLVEKSYRWIATHRGCAHSACNRRQ